MKKVIVLTIGCLLVATDWITLIICFYFLMNGQKDSAGLPATIVQSMFFSLVFFLVDICIIEEGGTKPL